MSFECRKCHQEFNKDNPEKKPKILKCGDTLCVECLTNNLSNSKIICPICKLEIIGNIDEIRTNIFAYNTKNTIICVLCGDEFENSLNSKKAPKVLKCGDTLCFECIKKNYNNQIIFCPICRKKNKENLEELPINKLATNLVEKEILNNSEFFTKEKIISCNYQFSIGLMDDQNVGKTCITHYFYKGTPLIKPQNTIGYEFHYKLYCIKNNNIKVRLWDTAGQEVFRSLAMGVLKGVAAVLIVFSLTLPYNQEIDTNLYYKWKNADNEEKENINENLTTEVFDNVRSWYNQFTQINNEKEKIIYLIGNKVDDVEHRIIKREDAINLAKELSLKYFETSAITGENIDKIFSQLCLELIAKCQKKKIAINLNGYKNKTGSKCC